MVVQFQSTLNAAPFRHHYFGHSKTRTPVLPSAVPVGHDRFTPTQKIQHLSFGQRNQEVPVYNLKELKSKLLKVQNNEQKRLAIGRPFLQDLKEYGALRIEGHGVNSKTVNTFLDQIAKVLGQPAEALKQFVTNDISMFRGLQIKINKDGLFNDPKRVFSMGAHGNIVMNGHKKFTDAGQNLYGEFSDVSKDMLEVISLIYEGKTDGLLTRFAFDKTLETPKPYSKDATLRGIYYPSAAGLKRDGITITDTLQDSLVRLRPHLDYGLITVLPASREPGLHILPHSVAEQHNVLTEDDVRKVPLDKWVKANSKPGELLIQIGRQMDIATQNMVVGEEKLPISATWHAVLANDQEIKTHRTSAAMFIENKSTPLMDYQGTLSSQQHVQATYQCSQGVTRLMSPQCLY